MIVKKKWVLSHVGFKDYEERLGALTHEKMVTREEAKLEFCKWALTEEMSWR